MDSRAILKSLAAQWMIVKVTVLVVLMCMPGCGGTDKLWTVYDQQKTPAGKVSILEEILSQDPEAYRMERVEGQVEPQKVSADSSGSRCGGK